MQTPNILVVDDDKDILKRISIRWKAAGYATVRANTGAAASEDIELQRPDLVISDYRTP